MAAVVGIIENMPLIASVAVVWWLVSFCCPLFCGAFIKKTETPFFSAKTDRQLKFLNHSIRPDHPHHWIKIKF